MSKDTPAEEVNKAEPELEKPKIVCLCGSTRFGQAFQDYNLKETMAGNIILSIGCNMKSDMDIFGHLPEQELAVIKQNLDELHKRKIDLADEIFVLDVDGYIGTSTRSEIDYAIAHNKPVRYLSKEYPEYKLPPSPPDAGKEQEAVEDVLRWYQSKGDEYRNNTLLTDCAKDYTLYKQNK